MKYAIAAVALAALVYRVTQVRKARFVRLDEMQRRFRHLVAEPEKMTYQEAEEIMKLSQLFDMPWIIALSLSFALFRTYAIPSISAVLTKSNQLASPKNAGRRAEDTAVVISEFLLGGLDSERGSTALARMNWLHGRYGSMITRDDLLYTLSLFIFEPILFIEQFEWRSLSEVEQQARYVFWREIGARMKIADIPPTRQELWDWKEAYARKAYKYSPNNTKTGDATFSVLLKPLPSFLKGFGKTATMVFLDDQTREAFGYPRPPGYLYVLVPGLVKLKGLVCGWLLMPASKPPAFLTVEKRGSMLVRKGFLFEPWYVDPSASPVGAFGYGQPGGEWQAGGFVPERLGPEKLVNDGIESVRKNAAEIREAVKLCPFFAA